MIFGTHLALDNSDHVLDGGPNPPTEGFFFTKRTTSCVMHNGGFTKRTTSRSGRPSSAVAELLLEHGVMYDVVNMIGECPRDSKTKTRGP